VGNNKEALWKHLMSEQTSSIDQRLDKLIEITAKQAKTAELQQQSIQSLAAAFTEQAKAYREFSRGLPGILETSRRSAQSAEGATYMPQRTLDAVWDLIEELRQDRENR